MFNFGHSCAVAFVNSSNALFTDLVFYVIAIHGQVLTDNANAF